MIPGICLCKRLTEKLLQIHIFGGFKGRFLRCQIVDESASFDIVQKCLTVSLSGKCKDYFFEAHSPQGENFHIAKFPENDATMIQTLNT